MLEMYEESEFQRKLLQEKLEKSMINIEEILKNFTAKIKLQDHEILRLSSDLKNCNKLITDSENLLEEKDVELAQKSTSNNNSLQIKEFYVRVETQEKDIKELKTTNIALSNKLKQSYEEIMQQNEQVKMLTERLAVAKKKSYEQSQQIKSKTPITPRENSKSRLLSDNPDERFVEYLKNYGVENQFKKVTEGLYEFGSNKKVSVAIKNASLVCRVGGGFMMIDQFLRLFITQERKLEEDENKLLGALISPRDRKTISPNTYVHKRSNTFSLFTPKKPQNENDESGYLETDKSGMKTDRSSGVFKENYDNLNTPSPVRLKIPKTTEKQIQKIVQIPKDKAFTPLSKSLSVKRMIKS